MEIEGRKELKQSVNKLEERGQLYTLSKLVSHIQCVLNIQLTWMLLNNTCNDIDPKVQDEK